MILIYSFFSFLNCFLKIEYFVAIVIALAYILGTANVSSFLPSIIAAEATFGLPIVFTFPHFYTVINLPSKFFLGTGTFLMNI